MADSPSWFQALLLNESTDKYHIEYNGFLSNHMSHGIVALRRLGANESRLRQFVSVYSEKLEKPVEETDHIQDVWSIRGNRTHYNALKSYYTKLLTEHGDIDSFIRAEFPKVSEGLVCSALHGLIHTGYGYAVPCGRIVAEGLAYLHHSYSPLILSPGQRSLVDFGKGTRNILDVLAEVRADEQLRDFMRTEMARRFPLTRKKFQSKVFTLFEGRGDRLVGYANSIEISPLAKMSANKGKPEMTVLGHWLTDCALAVYAMSQARNDFFLIHGVTAAWSLCQILPVFADQTEAGQAEAMKAIRVFVCGLIAVYVAQGCPALTESQLDVKVRTWEQIISDALSRDCDEHIYKLVQVCHERSVENKELKMAQLYLKAAQVALDHPLIFGGEPTK